MTDPTLMIVGGGIAGAACALRAAQYELPTAWILGDKSTHHASRAAYVKDIGNMLGVHPDIMRSKIVDLLHEEFPEAAERVRQTSFLISTMDLVANARARIESEFAGSVRLVADKAVAAERRESGFRLTLAGDETVEAPYLIIATGVMDRQPTVYKRKGEQDVGGSQWIYPYANAQMLLYCVRSEGHLTRGHRVGVLGDGKQAANMAMAVRERYGVDVTILTNGEPIRWGETEARLLAAHGIRVVEGRLTDVHGADRGATLHGFTIEDGERVDLDIAIVALGIKRVYNDLAVELDVELETGEAPVGQRQVLVDARGETSVPGCFAVGDMIQRRDEGLMKQIYTAQEYAVRAVDAIDLRRRQAMRAALLAG